MRRRRNPEIIAGRVNGDGTIANGDEFSVVRTATGTYSVTVPLGFRIASVVACASDGSPRWPSVTQTGEHTFTVYMYTNVTTLADLEFSFVAVGVQK